jgi:hypothetical protein
MINNSGEKMKFRTYSHRYIDGLLETNTRERELWEEFSSVLSSISEEDIIEHFNNQVRKAKSISEAINRLIDERLVAKGWNAQSPIFKEPAYVDMRSSTWTLDFAKESIAVEVAFNHAGSIAWNMIKPVLSSELNHVEKAIQTKMGIIVSATSEMKKVGGFDNAIGYYEKFVEYVKPLNNLLTTPVLLVGLEAPETFSIEHKKNSKGTKYGVIRRNNSLL